MKKQAVFSDRVAAGVVRVGGRVVQAVAGDGTHAVAADRTHAVAGDGSHAVAGDGSHAVAADRRAFLCRISRVSPPTTP